MSDDDSNDDENVSETKEKMDDVSRDQLDKIKARTMYNMVEPLDSGNKKLLFLTNAQALLLASEPQSMEKMLLQLDINEPQLVINLLHSPGKQLNTVCWSDLFFDLLPFAQKSVQGLLMLLLSLDNLGKERLDRLVQDMHLVFEMSFQKRMHFLEVGLGHQRLRPVDLRNIRKNFERHREARIVFVELRDVT